MRSYTTYLLLLLPYSSIHITHYVDEELENNKLFSNALNLRKNHHYYYYWCIQTLAGADSPPSLTKKTAARVPGEATKCACALWWLKDSGISHWQQHCLSITSTAIKNGRRQKFIETKCLFAISQKHFHSTWNEQMVWCTWMRYNYRKHLVLG